MQNSTIEWTNHTFSPWHGCVKVSPGCTNCYALALDRRFGRAVWGPAKTTPRMGMSKAYWKQPFKWNRDALRDGVRRRVFCASMADVFEDHPGVVEWRSRLWEVIGECDALDWQLLTKRPENVLSMVPPAYAAGYWLPHVWIGTSVENQEQADKRIPELLKIPASVRFLSCEPLLGPLNLAPYVDPVGGACCGGYSPCGCLADWPWDERRQEYARVHWVIAGGESGPGARPCQPDWVREIRDVCAHVKTPFHFKQWGQYEPYEEDAQEPFWRDQHGKLHDAHWLEVLNPSTGDINPGWHEDSILSPYLFRRVGKHAAGRLLDGREWNEFPS